MPTTGEIAAIVFGILFVIMVIVAIAQYSMNGEPQAKIDNLTAELEKSKAEILKLNDSIIKIREDNRYKLDGLENANKKKLDDLIADNAKKMEEAQLKYDALAKKMAESQIQTKDQLEKIARLDLLVSKYSAANELLMKLPGASDVKVNLTDAEVRNYATLMQTKMNDLNSIGLFLSKMYSDIEILEKDLYEIVNTNKIALSDWNIKNPIPVASSQDISTQQIDRYLRYVFTTVENYHTIIKSLDEKIKNTKKELDDIRTAMISFNQKLATLTTSFGVVYSPNPTADLPTQLANAGVAIDATMAKSAETRGVLTSATTALASVRAKLADIDRAVRGSNASFGAVSTDPIDKQMTDVANLMDVVRSTIDLWNKAKATGCPKNYSMSNSGKCIYTGEVCPLGKCVRVNHDGVNMCWLKNEAGDKGSFMCDASGTQELSTGYGITDADPKNKPILLTRAADGFNMPLFGNRAPGYFSNYSYTPRQIQGFGSIRNDNLGVWNSGSSTFYNLAPDTFDNHGIIYTRYTTTPWPSAEDIATIPMVQ